MNSLIMCMLILILAVFTEVAPGQDVRPIRPDSATKIVPSNVAIKDGARLRAIDTAVLSALRYFRKTQNIDGSWGANDEQGLATPLILLSFLRRGEKESSREFGDTITRARAWVLGASSTGTTERIVTVVCLSLYCDISYSSSKPDQKTNEVGKIQYLLSQIPQPYNSPWLDFARFYTMPADLSKPSWMRQTDEVHNKYLNLSTNTSILTVDDYLQMYLVTLAAYYRGGKSWHDFNRTTTTDLIKRQQADGGFPVSDGQNRFAATALTTLRLEIYNQYEPNPK